MFKSKFEGNLGKGGGKVTNPVLFVKGETLQRERVEEKSCGEIIDDKTYQSIWSLQKNICDRTLQGRESLRYDATITGVPER